MSHLWDIFENFELTENIRARDDSEFAEFLLRVGNGSEPIVHENFIHILDELLILYADCNTSINMLIDVVFDDLKNNYQSPDYLMTRGILASKNEYVDDINQILIHQFSKRPMVYYSFDSAVDSARTNCLKKLQLACHHMS